MGLEQSSQQTRPGAPPVPADVRGAGRARRDQERTFVAIYRRHHQALYRYCRAILHDHEDAQDALQSTMLAALRALPHAGGRLALRPWLFRIAHNESISLLRKRSPQRTREVDLDALAAAGASPSAAEEMMAAEQLRELLADIQSLPERQRGALLMRELSGLPIAEIALALEVSEGASKQLIFEARSALHDLQEGRSMGCESVRELIGAGDRRTLRGRRVRAHLRACESCRAFAESIAARERTLQALFPPLPLAASAALLQRLLAGVGAHGGRAASLSATGAGVSSAGIGANHAGLALLAKVLAGVLLAAGAAAGGMTLAASHTPRAASAPAHRGSGAKAAADLSRARGRAGGRAPAASSAHRHRASGASVGRKALVRRAGASGASATSDRASSGAASPGAPAPTLTPAPSEGGRSHALLHGGHHETGPSRGFARSQAGAHRRAASGRSAAGEGRANGHGEGHREGAGRRSGAARAPSSGEPAGGRGAGRTPEGAAGRGEEASETNGRP